MWGHIRIESLLTDVLLLKMLGAHQNTRVLHEIPKENLTFLSFPDKESNGLVRNGGYYGDELGFPGGSDSKESACNAGDLGLIPGLGRSPEGGHGNHSSILAWRIIMDRGAWRARVYGVAKSWT